MESHPYSYVQHRTAERIELCCISPAMNARLGRIKAS